MLDSWQELLIAGLVLLGAVAIVVFGLRPKWKGTIGAASECAYDDSHAQMLGRIDANVKTLCDDVAVQNKKLALTIATSEALVHVGDAAIKYMTKKQLNGEVKSAEESLHVAKELIAKTKEVEA